MRILKLIFLCSLIFSTFCFGNEQKNILIINSYYKGFQYGDEIVKAIEKRFSYKTKIYTNIVYLEKDKLNKKGYLKSFSKKIEENKYDLVITIDKLAYRFILEKYNLFFTKEKVLALALKGVNKEEIRNSSLKNKISFLFKKNDLIENINIISRIAAPNLKNIFIVNDRRLGEDKRLENFIQNYKSRYKLHYKKPKDLKELKSFFDYIPYNSVILFLKFFEDENGHFIENIDIENLILESKTPVFVTDSLFLKRGAVGGKVINLSDYASESAKLALEIIDEDKRVTRQSNDYKYIFDEQKIKQFYLSISRVNEKYELVNESFTFFDKYRAFIDFVFVIVPIFILLIIGLIDNIYMRKKFEKALLQRLEFDSVLLNAVETPIFWQDDKGHIVDANVEFCTLLNLKYEELYGKKLTDFVLNKNVKKVLKILRKYNVDNKKSLEFIFSDKENNKRVFFIKRAKYNDKKTKTSGLVTIFTDVTAERKFAESQRRSQQFFLQQSKLAEIGEVFSSIAHQWKAPLVEITTIAQEIFYSSNNKNRNEDESYVKDIMVQVKYMNDTINDFQDFMKPSNKMIVFNIEEAIFSLLKIVEHNIRFNYIDININIKEGTNVYIKGYRNEFMQSFLNIINNAKDELVKKDFKERNITIDIYNKQERLIIHIRDNAGGIKKKDMDSVFKPYYSTKEQGSGIGLYMAKVIIEDKMNGKISVNNVEGGACFTIKLEQKNENISS